MSRKVNRTGQAAAGQLSLEAFAQGSVVRLDGGQRLRLDGKVDFWPASGAWKSLVSSEIGHGATTMLAFLMSQRRAEGAFPEPAAVKTDRKVACNYCGELAQLYAANVVYPGREDLADRLCWVCWPCNAWVGCHKTGDGTAPMGTLADQLTRDARTAAHAAFDLIWQRGEMERPEAYAWLAASLGITPAQCHIAGMDQHQCYRVVELVKARNGGLDDDAMDATTAVGD